MTYQFVLADVLDRQRRPDLASYDHVLVMFSGGKDSLACVEYLLAAGVDPAVIELWHHDVDGALGGAPHFMDWPITTAYCRAVAQALGLPIYFSYRVGGFEQEMCRRDTPTAAIRFEDPERGWVGVGGQSDILCTREQYPQVGAITSGRWCSVKAKIEVMQAAIRNQRRFKSGHILIVTGERAEESPTRARYKVLEESRLSTQTRLVDQFRPIHRYTEEQVWAAVRRLGIVPHPAYRLGYGRLSCRTCIFSSNDQWATNAALYPVSTDRVASYEQRWGKTIRRGVTIGQVVAQGTPYAAALAQPELAALANGTEWRGPVKVDPAEWILPAGAYGENCGPS